MKKDASIIFDVPVDSIVVATLMNGTSDSKFQLQYGIKPSENAAPDSIRWVDVMDHGQPVFLKMDNNPVIVGERYPGKFRFANMATDDERGVVDVQKFDKECCHG